jgi:pyrroline-5-carboxylate reductase
MSVTLPTIAILGAGSMGGAILTGLASPDVTVTGGIRVTNRSSEKASGLQRAGVTSLSTAENRDANLTAVAGAQLVVIGVKPPMVPALLAEIAPALEADAVVVSVAAGVRIATMEALVPGSVVRAMPNTPAIVGRGVTGIATGTRSSVEDMALVRVLFETVGVVLEVPEAKIDAVSTISGSGPAYVFYLIEQLTQTAMKLGFTPAEAALMVNTTFLGSSELLASSGLAPAELRRRVTSPNGTTERAIAEFERAELSGVFDRATAAALARALELGNSLS